MIRARCILGLTAETNFKFRAVYVNEASVLGSKKNWAWRVIQVIPKVAIGLCTATATPNKIEGLQGLAMLIFVTSDLPRVSPEMVPSTNVLLSASPKYNADEERWTTKSATDNPMVAELQRMHTLWGWRWWFLFPDALEALGSGTDRAHRTQAVDEMRMIWLRRAMSTVPTLPKMKIIGVDLGYEDAKLESFVTGRTNALIKSMGRLVKRGAAKSYGVPKLTPAQCDVKRSTEDNEADQASAGRARAGFAVVRLAAHLACDIHAYDLQLVDDELANSTQDQANATFKAAALAASSIEPVPPATVTEPRAAIDQGFAQQFRPETNTTLTEDKRKTVLSSDMVRDIANSSWDGGIAWVMQMLDRTGGDYVPGTGPWPRLVFSMNKSPLIAYIVQRCVQWVKEGKKAIIMVNLPWIQRYVSCSRLVCHGANGSL